jgi:bacterioferritin (cytochrome b1)
MRSRDERSRALSGVGDPLPQRGGLCHARLFENLMKDEEHHVDLLETQLDLVERIGLELYTQSHVGGLAAEEH